MGGMFQLSIELYDTQEKKVVWSDRWQEKWDNLSSIKGSLSDGLLKALDTKPKTEQKVDTTNPEAYELYLKAKQKYSKRENSDDTEIARGLLVKAIELDDNLISAKLLFGDTYIGIGDSDKAMEIYTSALEKATKLDDKLWIGHCTRKVGGVHGYKGDVVTTADYFKKSLAIAEELGDREGVGFSLGNIGIMHSIIGDYDKALEYYEMALNIFEELGDKSKIELMLGNIGKMYNSKGDYKKALGYYTRTLTICEELADNFRILEILYGIGVTHNNKGDYDRAKDNLEKSLNIQKKNGLDSYELFITIYLYLTYKHLGNDYDEKEIQTLVKEAHNIDFEINFRLYEILEDNTYLEKAYNQVQEKASAMDKVLKAKFLSYPIPKAIVEEWEKVN